MSLLKGNAQGIQWSAVEVMDSSTDNGGITQSSAVVKPGNSLSGFSFESVMPPANKQFSVTMFKVLPVFTTEEELEDGLSSLSALDEEAIRGNTLAPATTISEAARKNEV